MQMNKKAMRDWIKLIVVVGLSSSAALAAAEESVPLCKDFDGSTESIYNCVGKEVTFVADHSTHYEQHPVGGPDSFECKGEVVKNKSGFLDCKGEWVSRYGYETAVTIRGAADADSMGDLILKSDKLIECRRSINVTGVVNIHSLGGSPGTKGEYSRARIYVKDYKCKD